MIAQKIARREDQIVEIELGGRTLVVPETGQHRLYLSDEVAQDATGDVLDQILPGLAARGVMRIRRDVQPFAFGLGQAFALGGFDPFALLLVGKERAGFGAEVGMRLCNQQSHQADWRFDDRPAVEPCGHSGEALGEHGGFFLHRWCGADELHQTIDGVMESAQVRGQAADRRRGNGPAFAQVGDDLVDQADGFAGIVQHHFRDDAAFTARELFAQPRLDDFDESEIGLVAVHLARAGIDVRLDRA